MTERQRIVRDFLDWLANVHGADIETLLGETPEELTAAYLEYCNE